MRIAFVLSLLALTACEEMAPTKYPQYEVDQEKRTKLFASCMAQLPEGPRSTNYNDWDEVVHACDDVARVQSIYCYQHCRPQPSAEKAE